MVTEEQLKLFELPEITTKKHVFTGLRHPLWTEHKAKLISRYLYYFVLITKHGVYIDGFAGPQAPNERETWAARLVLESEPKWMRNFFLCDNDPKQIEALEALRDAQPEIKGRTIEVERADFNVQVDKILATRFITEKTAAFCLLDQRTFECDWRTVQKVARRKSDHKIEIFYFVPTGWLARAISGLREPGPTMKRWWGKEDWERLLALSNNEIVDWIRRRFREELSYNYAYGWPIYEQDASQRIMYHMVHATDHAEAPNLMARAYRRATRRVEPPEQFTLEFDTWAETHGRTIEPSV